MKFQFLKYFLIWAFLQFLQLLLVGAIQNWKYEQHDFTDCKLIAFVIVVCKGMGDIRNDIKNNKQKY